MKRKACERRFFDAGNRFFLFFLYFCIQYARRAEKYGYRGESCYYTNAFLPTFGRRKNSLLNGWGRNVWNGWSSESFR